MTAAQDLVAGTAIGVTLIEGFENLDLHAYLDEGGVPTIGYGNTAMLDGTKVKLGMVLKDEPTARALMMRAIGLIVPKLAAMVKVPLTPSQIGALLSLQYNIGSGALNTSTLLKYLNKSDLKNASAQFLVWNQDNGRVIAGLTNRRKKERAVFDGVVSATLPALAEVVTSAPIAAPVKKKPAPKKVASATDDLNSAELAKHKKA